MRYVRFVDEIAGRKDPVWGVGTERTIVGTISGERSGYDVWDVMWADGGQGTYPGRDLEIGGQVPGPVEVA